MFDEYIWKLDLDVPWNRRRVPRLLKAASKVDLCLRPEPLVTREQRGERYYYLVSSI